jgi:hypothetical protein
MADPCTLNTYAAGNCTFWVRQNACWVPNRWGNAAEWLGRAQAAGFKTSQNPAQGAVAVWGPGVDPPLGFGHVALVTAVRPDNSFTVSEMNWKGLGVVDTRNVSDHSNLLGFILPAGSASGPPAPGAAASASGGDPFGIQATGTQLVSAAQVGAGGLLIVAGLLLAVLLIFRPQLPIAGAAGRLVQFGGRAT